MPIATPRALCIVEFPPPLVPLRRYSFATPPPPPSLLSAMGPFSDLTDTLLGDRADWGSMKCGCHPNCGIGTVLFVHKVTKECVPLGARRSGRPLARRAGHHRRRAAAGHHARGDRPRPPQELPREPRAAGLRVRDAHPTVLEPDRRAGARCRRVRGGRARDTPNGASFRGRDVVPRPLLHDFRRTEMCIILYGTQMGEISFARTTRGSAGDRCSRR